MEQLPRICPGNWLNERLNVDVLMGTVEEIVYANQLEIALNSATQALPVALPKRPESAGSDGTLGDRT